MCQDQPEQVVWFWATEDKGQQCRRTPGVGALVRNIGCHMGLDLTAKQGIAPLLLSFSRYGGDGNPSALGHHVLHQLLLDFLEFFY